MAKKNITLDNETTLKFNSIKGELIKANPEKKITDPIAMKKIIDEVYKNGRTNFSQTERRK